MLNLSYQLHEMKSLVIDRITAQTTNLYNLDLNFETGNAAMFDF